MIKTIEIEQGTFERLEKHTVGFSDTPNAVISRILDEVENKSDKKPDLSFFPPSEEKFKELLIKKKEAEITLYKKDGSRSVQYWNAKRFTETSNLRANLWSGQLRDWKTKGIVKADLCIYRTPGRNDDENMFHICKIIAPILNVPCCDLQDDFDFDHEIEGSGNDAKLIINFHDTCDIDDLKNIPGIDLITQSVVIQQHELDYPLT